MQTDTELVLAALNGRRTAYEDLVRRWGRRVVAICHARIGNADAVDDLAQETLLRGWKHLSTLKQPEEFGAWLRGIAEHVCLDWIRRNVSRREAHQRLFAVAASTRRSEVAASDSEVAQQDEHQRVWHEIDQLPEPLRNVVFLHYYDDITYDEIADVLGIARATVNTRLAKARCLLAHRLATFVETDQGEIR